MPRATLPEFDPLDAARNRPPRSDEAEAKPARYVRRLEGSSKPKAIPPIVSAAAPKRTPCPELGERRSAGRGQLADARLAAYGRRRFARSASEATSPAHARFERFG